MSSPGGEETGEGGQPHKLQTQPQSHKVIVPLTVPEILDEQVAMKVV